MLLCCSALSNFNDIMRMTKPGSNVDAWEEAIVAFCADIAELRIKTTIKIHIVDDHISTFVKSFAGGFSLAAYTEQAMESCHYYHASYSQRCNVPKNYRRHSPENVLRSVNLWNGDRITFAEFALLKASRDSTD